MGSSKNEFFVIVWENIAHPNFICLYVCICVLLLRRISIDQIWVKLGGKYWNLDPIDSSEISLKSVSDDAIPDSFPKGQNSAAKGKTVTQATAILIILRLNETNTTCYDFFGEKKIQTTLELKSKGVLKILDYLFICLVSGYWHTATVNSLVQSS